MLILSVESSCDETSAAIVKDGRTLLSNVVASQIEEHRLYGGVVPEIASRMHCESIVGVVNEALQKACVSKKQINAVAVTYAPGLIGALLVGVNFSKGLSYSLNIPIIPVHHIRGHIAANYIVYPDLTPPYMCLVASGGHTIIVMVEDYTKFRSIGSTIDDAAGEAFDKAARAMGFPYPGGAFIDKASKKGDENMYRLPRPHTANKYDFSFSGLKTAVINLINNSEQKNEPLDMDSLAASFQFTVCDILCSKFIAAAKENNCHKIALAGGVAANSCLRSMLADKASENKMSLYAPPLYLCGDNAAMIGCQGYYEYVKGKTAGSGLNAYAVMSLENAVF